MIDIMPDDKEISKALNVLNSISDKLRLLGIKKSLAALPDVLQR
nr:MAG TPA: hypothetical protein [Caudoviricetes sp.]